MDKTRRELFNRLLDEHGNRIYAFAFGLCGNETEACDMVAEAFMKAYRSFDGYDKGKPFYSWIYKITQNIYLDRMRSAARRKTVSAEDLGEGVLESIRAHEKRNDLDESPDSRAQNRETAAMIQKALDKMPAEFREALMLCDMMQMDYKRISGILGVPIGTVRSRIFRGRCFLRDILKPYISEGRPV
ncbi:RNA polymerase sigma factor [Elusimicrobiota bacterium]